MVAFTSKRMLRDFGLLIFAIVCCSLFMVDDVHEMIRFCVGHTDAFGVLTGLVLVSSSIASLVLGVRKQKQMNHPLLMLVGLILTSNGIFLVAWQTDIFAGMEKFIMTILCLFGLWQCCWLFFAAYWTRIPGLVNRVIVVGNGQIAHDMSLLASSAGPRYELLSYIECTAGKFGILEEQAVQPSRIILDRAKKVKANMLVVSLSERRGAFPLQQVLACRLSGIDVFDAPDFYELVHKKMMLEKLNPSALIFYKGFKIVGVRRFAKRLMDIVLSFVGLVLIAPFMPLVALAIKLDSPGPVIFKQVRVGMGEQPFVIYKFRSMCQNAEAQSGAVWAQKNDTRITRLGKMLRKSRIDELPQLFNVLIGDMSLVGPRPERPEFVKDLKKQVPYYSERHFVKPGVTGWAQVKYPYGSSVEDAIEKLRYDLYYIKKFTLFFDYKIMLDTIVVMVKKMGR